MIPIVPAQLPALLAHGNRSGRIGNIIIGGAPLSYDQEKAVAESGLNAYATYGMTETCSHVALRKIGKDSFYHTRCRDTHSLPIVADVLL